MRKFFLMLACSIWPTQAWAWNKLKKMDLNEEDLNAVGNFVPALRNEVSVELYKLRFNAKADTHEYLNWIRNNLQLTLAECRAVFKQLSEDKYLTEEQLVSALEKLENNNL